MATINTEYGELEVLKQQFDSLERILANQKILNKTLMHSVMSQKTTKIEQWYRARFSVLFIIPILLVIFIYMNLHWGYITMVALISVAEFLLNFRSYRALCPKTLAGLDMATASERVARHQQMRDQIKRLMVVPMTVLIIWTVMIACDYTWNPQLIILCVFLMAVAYVWGRKMTQHNRKVLQELLSCIEQLRCNE